MRSRREHAFASGSIWIPADFSVERFLGPALGPIIGGFVSESIGWRWVQGLMAIATGTLTVVYIFSVPETYPLVILQRRAMRLSKATGIVYKSQFELKQGPKTLSKVLKIALSRPWILLVYEPIVLILSLYQAIIYATLYLCFGKLKTHVSRSDPVADIGSSSCVPNRLSRKARLVSWNRRPCIPRCNDRHDLHHPVQYLDQQAVR